MYYHIKLYIALFKLRMILIYLVIHHGICFLSRTNISVLKEVTYTHLIKIKNRYFIQVACIFLYSLSEIFLFLKNDILSPFSIFFP